MDVRERADYQRAARQSLFEQSVEAFEDLAHEVVCRGCGCSESLACPEGCSWATVAGFLLCSACDAEMPADSPMRAPFPERVVMLPGATLRGILDPLGQGWIAFPSPLGRCDYMVHWPGRDGLTVVHVS